MGMVSSFFNGKWKIDNGKLPDGVRLSLRFMALKNDYLNHFPFSIFHYQFSIFHLFKL